MRLMDGYVSHQYTIDAIHLKQKERVKLERLKLKEGSVITIIQKYKHYPFLISLEGNRIALDHAIAKAIEVIPYD